MNWLPGAGRYSIINQDIDATLEHYYTTTYSDQSLATAAAEFTSDDADKDAQFVRLTYPNASYIHHIAHGNDHVPVTELYCIRKINSWDNDFIGQGETIQAAWANAKARIIANQGK